MQSEATNKIRLSKIFRPSNRGVNNACIRRIEIAQKPKQDIILLVATFLTAVAAFASAYAAFRQEHATFTSQLYNKQIDTFSAIEAGISNYIRNVKAIKEGCGKSNISSGYNPELLGAYYDLEAKFNAGRFVSPEDYRVSLHELQDDLNGVNIQIMRSYVTGNNCDDTLEYLNIFIHNSDNLFKCSLNNLPNGSPLEPDKLNSCYKHESYYDGR